MYCCPPDGSLDLTCLVRLLQRQRGAEACTSGTTQQRATVSQATGHSPISPLQQGSCGCTCPLPILAEPELNSPKSDSTVQQITACMMVQHARRSTCHASSPKSDSSARKPRSSPLCVASSTFAADKSRCTKRRSAWCRYSSPRAISTAVSRMWRCRGGAEGGRCVRHQRWLSSSGRQPCLQGCRQAAFRHTACGHLGRLAAGNAGTHHLWQPLVCNLEDPALNGLVQGSHVAVLHHQLDLQPGRQGSRQHNRQGGIRASGELCWRSIARLCVPTDKRRFAKWRAQTTNSPTGSSSCCC